MSNLRLINETTASSVSSVSVTDVFTADYDIYKIVVPTYQPSTADTLLMRLVNASGSVISASNYDKATQVLRSYNTFQEDYFSNISNFFQMSDNNASAVGIGLTVYCFNPFSSSSYSFILQQEFSNGSAGTKGYKGIGVLKQTASMGGFHFYGNGGHNFDINIRTYGLRVDS